MAKKETLWWRNREDIRLYEREQDKGGKLLALCVMCLFVVFSLLFKTLR